MPSRVTVAAIITGFIVTVSLTIFLSLFFAIVWKDKEIIEESESGVCNTTSFTDVPYRCCDMVNCRCNECDDDDAQSCSVVLSNLQEGPCCGGYECCYYGCDTCYRSETYNCNCYGTTQERTCDTCTRQVAYDCNCYCRDEVDHETCESVCGTCHRMTAVLTVYLDDGSEATHTETKVCSRDDRNCVAEFTEVWNVVEKQCWYHADKDNVYWDEPEHNIAAIVFCAIFGSLVLIAPIAFVVYFYKEEYSFE